jgi:hypothetical protein
MFGLGRIVLGALVLAAAAVPAAAQTAAGPSPSLAKDSRCFELRTYYALPGRLEALHARFRNHTNRLFQKHGMTLVGYWVPTDPAKGANTLIYVLAYPTCEAREKSWEGFRKDPEWNEARTASEKDGKIVDKVESVLMTATDYSPMK